MCKYVLGTALIPLHTAGVDVFSTVLPGCNVFSLLYNVTLVT